METPRQSEQNTDRVEDEERGEYHECVDGGLRLSATDFALSRPR